MDWLGRGWAKIRHEGYDVDDGKSAHCTTIEDQKKGREE